MLFRKQKRGLTRDGLSVCCASVWKASQRLSLTPSGPPPPSSPPAVVPLLHPVALCRLPAALAPFVSLRVSFPLLRRSSDACGCAALSFHPLPLLSASLYPAVPAALQPHTAADLRYVGDSAWTLRRTVFQCRISSVQVFWFLSAAVTISCSASRYCKFAGEEIWDFFLLFP